MSQPQRKFGSITFLITTFAVLLGFSIWYWIDQSSQQKYFMLNEESVVSIPDDVSDWKTYRNEEYGFEFEYPLSWNLSNKLDKASNYSALLIGENGQYITIHMDIGKEEVKIMSKKDSNLTMYTENKNINGLDVVDRIMHRVDGATGDRQIAFFEANNYFRVVLKQELDLIENGVEKYQKSKESILFETIASTFKFTK